MAPSSRPMPFVRRQGARRERRLHRRRRHPPVRAHRAAQRTSSRASSRSARRSPTPASSGATCSSRTAVPTPPAMPTRSSTQLGLTGLQFINVANGCATGGSALFGVYAGDQVAAVRSRASRWASTSIRAARSIRCPRDWGLPDWYGEVGLMLTTQFFAMKLRRYMDQLRHHAARARTRRGEGIPERRARRARVAAHARRHRHDLECADDQ